MSGETWRPISGYEGLYEVSDQGRVRSYHRDHAGHVMAQVVDGKGYRQVQLSAGGKVKIRKVHQLVAAAFHGPLPVGMVTRHLNGVKTDNRLANLAYGTHSDNLYDDVRNGTHHAMVKTHCVRGHALSGCNLRKLSKPHHRGCLACNRMTPKVSVLRRAGSVVTEEFMQAESDRLYAEIVVGCGA